MSAEPVAGASGVPADPSPLVPGATLGVVGGGQLGRYFVLAARRLGYVTVVLDPDPHAPAMQVAAVPIVAAYDDPDALERLARECDAVTIEFENVPAAGLEVLASRTRVAPEAAAVALAQDRAEEKRVAARHGLEPVPWRRIGSVADIDALRGAPFAPSILKTARLGYDGKGQRGCDDADALASAFEAFGRVPCVLETRVELLAELSVVLARAADGASVAFPPAANVHVAGVLHVSSVPAGLDADLQRDAVDAARRLADGLGYVGVVAVEFFVVAGPGGRPALRFNEMAPRPHNSGHWTLDACTTSQFEQQVRCLAGLPLGEARALSPVTMLNLLGDAWSTGAPAFAEALALPGVALHLYGKAEPRAGRKMGHLNCLASDVEASRAMAARVHELLSRGDGQGGAAGGETGNAAGNAAGAEAIAMKRDPTG